MLFIWITAFVDFYYIRQVEKNIFQKKYRIATTGRTDVLTSPMGSKAIAANHVHKRDLPLSCCVAGWMPALPVVAPKVHPLNGHLNISFFRGALSCYPYNVTIQILPPL